jgi:hypothetical protein
MAEHLHAGAPNNYDVIYDSGFPEAALAYWHAICPQCTTWRNGNLQCGMFVMAAYGMAGVNLILVNRVIQWWNAYQSQQANGWQRIAIGTGPPRVGDILIAATSTSPDGHAAIVTQVTLASKKQMGSITIAQADATVPLTKLPLDAHNHVTMWTGATALGFLRYTKFPSVTPPGTLPHSTYVATAQQDAQEVGIPPTFFVAQINLESHFNPLAQSPAGAEGIAQLTAATAKAWGVDPWNPTAALMAAAQHMEQYTVLYNNDYRKALAAYNAGPQAVNAAVAQAAVRYGTPTRWLACLPQETQHYVNSILDN